MWHVAEGDLHAYLDGALDFYPPGDARRIREHLEGCAACRPRLDDAATVVSRARTVLADAAPVVLAPPLEELRRRADGDRPAESAPIRVVSHVRWAWAATVVLALGIGWGVGAWQIGRDPDLADSSSASATRPEAPTVAAAAEAVAEMEVDATPQAVASAAPQQTAAAPTLLADATANTVQEASRQERVTSTLSLDEIVVTGAAASERRVALGPVDEVPRRPAPELLAPPLAEDAAARLSRFDVPVVATSAREPVVTTAEMREQGAERRREAGPTPASPPVVAQTRITPGPVGDLRTSGARLGAESRSFDARRSGGSGGRGESAPLLIPGLEVLSVEWAEVAPPEEGVLVKQRMEDGTPVELRFVGVWPTGEDTDALRAAVGAAAAPPPAATTGTGAAAAPARPLIPPPHINDLPRQPGWNQVAAPFRSGWVVIQAPMSERRLRELLQSAVAGAPLN